MLDPGLLRLNRNPQFDRAQDSPFAALRVLYLFRFAGPEQSANSARTMTIMYDVVSHLSPPLYGRRMAHTHEERVEPFFAGSPEAAAPIWLWRLSEVEAENDFAPGVFPAPSSGRRDRYRPADSLHAPGRPPGRARAVDHGH